MPVYDAIIIGAGPAGGQCARELAQNGNKVLLIERSHDFNVNNYSSGGAPIETMEAFNLPESLVGTFWNHLTVSTSHQQHTWDSTEPVGVVLDFKKLRAFLADEAAKNGAEVKLGTAYESHEREGEYVYVLLKDQKTRTVYTVKTKVLVDGTGCERKVMNHSDPYDKKNALAISGMEYLVETTPECYQRYANTLSYLLGLKWMPQGYAWVFPMESNKLKIGVIRYFLHEDVVPHENSIRYYLDQLIANTVGKENATILDKHGKTLTYSFGQHDPRYDHNIIGIGDSISMLNPLASEGIRHAMTSGHLAAKYIHKYLNKEVSNFKGYAKEIKEYCGSKWKRSESIMKQVYRERDDSNFDRILKTFKRFNMQEMMQLAFGYDFRKSLKFAFYYLLSKLKRAPTS